MGDCNEFLSIFWKKLHSHSRHQKTQVILRITLKGILRVSNEWWLEGAMCINIWYNSWEHPKNDCFLQISQNIDGFRQKQFTKLLEFTKPTREIFLFHYWAKSYFNLALIWLAWNWRISKNDMEELEYKKKGLSSIPTWNLLENLFMKFEKLQTKKLPIELMLKLQWNVFW